MGDAIAIVAAVAAADGEEEPAAAERGCAYLLESKGGQPGRFCSAACRAGSAYCETHHARCHLPEGSQAEHRQLREIEALAAAVGGRQARLARRPSSRMLRRLEKAARTVAAHPDRSRIVRNGGHNGNPTDNRQGGG